MPKVKSEKTTVDEDTKYETVIHLVNSATVLLEQWLIEHDLNNDGLAYFRDLHHVRESLISLVCRTENLKHPWQEIVDRMIIESMDRNGNVYTQWKPVDEPAEV